MLRDGLRDFVLGPQPLCFGAVPGPERALDLSLTLIPEGQGNAESRCNRLIPRFTMVAPLHRDVRHPRLPLERRAELRLLDQLAQPPDRRMLLQRAGSQHVQIQPLPGLFEIALEGKLITQHAGRHHIQLGPHHHQGILGTGNFLLGLLYLDRGLHRFKNRGIARRRASLYSFQDLFDHRQMLACQLDIPLRKQHLIKGDLGFGNHVEAGLLHRGASPCRPCIRRLLSGPALPLPFQRLLDRHSSLRHLYPAARIANGPSPRYTGNRRIEIGPGRDLLAATLTHGALSPCHDRIVRERQFQHGA